MLKSKLSATKYPCLPLAEALKVLKAIGNCELKGTDPVLLGRTAALCKYLGMIGLINSAKRDEAYQIKLYIEDGGHKNPDGTYSGGSGRVAKPGTSRHIYGLAIDTASKWLKELDKLDASKKQKLLNRFGLHKPLTPGNKSNVYEDWHIEPIETYGVRYTAEAMRKLAPVAA